MKKEITAEEVKHIAELSRIALTEDECAAMREHLGKILGYFETLDGVDISGVSPTAHILDSVNVLRDDVPRESMSNEALLKNAPQSEDGAYIVPRVVE